MPTVSVELVALVLAAGGLFYYGGQLQTVVRQLRSIAEDHEGRLRRLEGLDIP